MNFIPKKRTKCLGGLDKLATYNNIYNNYNNIII